jgi:uridine kinase
MKFNKISGNFTTYKELMDFFNKERSDATYIVGIDGGGGAGKSTFAKTLQELDDSVMVIHKDDFYLPSQLQPIEPPDSRPIGSEFDWKRVLEQVLKPLSEKKPARYQRYDWESDQLAEWHYVPTARVVIIEGMYSLREEFSNYYDFKIWIETPYDIRLERGIERDGEEARNMWVGNWMIAEDVYKRKCKPYETADLVIRGIK